MAIGITIHRCGRINTKTLFYLELFQNGATESSFVTKLPLTAPPGSNSVQATHDLHCWEEEMAKISSGIKENSSSGQHRRAPRWTSCAKTDDECRNPKVVSLFKR